MKRIYMTLALLGALSMNVLAQRNVNVELIFKAPTNGTTINCTDSFTADYAFVNLGPDAVLATDTFAFADFESTYNSDGSIENIFIGVPTANVNAGDTINIGGVMWKSHMNRVETLIDTSSFEFINGPFPNGGYIAFAQFLGFGHIQSGSFVFDTTVVKDTVSNNNIDGQLITISCITGIEETQNNKVALHIFPNPVINVLNFKYSFTKSSKVNARITDIAGRTVITKEFGNTTPGLQSFSIDVSGLPAGTYLIELATEEGRGISKFMKK